MPRRSKNLQLSLFEDEAPRVVLAAAPMSDLAALVEALLREIATALANRETGDEARSRLSILRAVPMSTSDSRQPIS
jgi:hypothetical protein